MCIKYGRQYFINDPGQDTLIKCYPEDTFDVCMSADTGIPGCSECLLPARVVCHENICGDEKFLVEQKMSKCMEYLLISCILLASALILTRVPHRVLNVGEGRWLYKGTVMEVASIDFQGDVLESARFMAMMNSTCPIDLEEVQYKRDKSV
ncbi:unnamed protein product [Owenia fusiformis]|uniref:Uncharacterized protein n=1 Tax=Owenia fusiformis TaxID=6347 RepID=A0A8S4N2Y6_OWEFU|nr:unnamed protein product [Owenia fusiformis]